MIDYVVRWDWGACARFCPYESCFFVQRRNVDVFGEDWVVLRFGCYVILRDTFVQW